MTHTASARVRRGVLPCAVAASEFLAAWHALAMTPSAAVKRDAAAVPRSVMLLI